MPLQPPQPPTLPQKALGTLKFLVQTCCALAVLMAVGSVVFLLVVTLWRITVFLFTRFLANPW